MPPLPDARRTEAVDQEELRLRGGGRRSPEVDGGGTAVDLRRLRGQPRRRDGAADEGLEERDDAETGGGSH